WTQVGAAANQGSWVSSRGAGWSAWFCWGLLGGLRPGDGTQRGEGALPDGAATQRIRQGSGSGHVDLFTSSPGAGRQTCPSRITRKRLTSWIATASVAK